MTLSHRPASAAHAAHAALARAKRLLLVAATAGALVALVLALNPRAIADALRHFDPRAVLPLLLLSAGFYALQGYRWHLLLRHVGARGGAGESMVVNLAGQATSAVLPLGDLTRGLLISRSSGVSFGAAAATITVQELTFTLLVVAAAAPGLVHLPGGPLLMAVVLAGLVGIVLLLTVRPLFAQVRRVLAALPLVRRFTAEIDTLQREVVVLLRRPSVLAGSLLDAGRVVIAVAALMLILRGLHVASLGWSDAALVLGVSFVGGALSFLPGGVGANEAGFTALLVLLGVNPAAAAAAALIQRVWLVAVPTLGGTLAYLYLRRAVVSRPAVVPAAGEAMLALRGVAVQPMPVDDRERIAA